MVFWSGTIYYTQRTVRMTPEEYKQEREQLSKLVRQNNATPDTGKAFAWGYVISAILFVVILSIVIAYV